MELIKLTLEFQDDKGNKLKRILVGDDVFFWRKAIRELCEFAEEYGVNPEWDKLNWIDYTTKARKKRGSKNQTVEEIDNPDDLLMEF